VFARVWYSLCIYGVFIVHVLCVYVGASSVCVCVCVRYLLRIYVYVLRVYGACMMYLWCLYGVFIVY